MSKKIKYSPLWIAAKKNHKLTGYFYNEMAKLWKGLGKHEILHFMGERNINPAVLRRAFHSNLTKPEVRAMVLQKIFEPTYRYLPRLKAVDQAAYKDFSELALHVSWYKGAPYIALKTFNKFTYKYTKLNLTKKAKDELVRSLPLTIQSHRMIDAVREGNLKSMKAGLILQQLNEYFFSMVDLIFTTNKINNIWNFLFVTSDGEFTIDEVKDEWKEETIRGMRTDLFIKDLTHMQEEYKKILPTLSNLGIDTTDAMQAMDEVLFLAKNFKQYEQDNFDVVNLFEAHKHYFERMNNLSSLVVDMASQVNDLSSEVIVKKLRGKGFVPKFVHYNPNKSAFVRTTVRGGSRGIFETHRATTSFPVKIHSAEGILK